MTVEEKTTFAERLTRLFTERRRPDGRRWTLETVAAGCGERGVPTSAQYIAQLRAGERPPPRLVLVEAIADTFGVPVVYFFDDRIGEFVNEYLPALLALTDPSSAPIASRRDLPALLAALAPLDGPDLPQLLAGLADPDVRAAALAAGKRTRR
jgi:transcriptional regulator with XRE-family HTH domain